VTEVRLMSYNVRSLRDDAQAVSTVIRALKPDVVCIQEAPRFLRWRSKCAALARESGLYVVTGGRTAGAMLLLTSLRVRVVSAQDVLLSKKRGLHQRGLAIGVLEIEGARFGVASMHLDLDAGERRRHVDEVVGQLDQLQLPVVVAGDVNEEPHEPAWRALAAHYQDAYAVAPSGQEGTSSTSGATSGASGATYSAKRPVKRIDGVFVDPRITVISCGVPDVAGTRAASDHLPLLAVLRLPG
jgi:endonuclease/exonuclease/phosphatase family metal-dependent hydrolase